MKKKLSANSRNTSPLRTSVSHLKADKMLNHTQLVIDTESQGYFTSFDKSEIANQSMRDNQKKETQLVKQYYEQQMAKSI